MHEWKHRVSHDVLKLDRVYIHVLLTLSGCICHGRYPSLPLSLSLSLRLHLPSAQVLEVESHLFTTAPSEQLHLQNS